MTSQQTIELIRQALIARGFISEQVEEHQVQDHYSMYIQRYHADHSTNLPTDIEHLPEGKLKEEALRILNGDEGEQQSPPTSFEDAILGNGNADNTAQPVAPAEANEPTDPAEPTESQEQEPVNETAPETESEGGNEGHVETETVVAEGSDEPVAESDPVESTDSVEGDVAEGEDTPVEVQPETESEQAPATESETENEVAPEAVVINLPETLEFLEGEDLEIDIRAGQEFNYASGDAIAEGTEITVEVNAFDADIEINQTETGHFVVSGLTADHDGANLVAHVNVGGLTESHTFTLELVE